MSWRFYFGHCRVAAFEVLSVWYWFSTFLFQCRIQTLRLGVGGHPDPEIRGRGQSPKIFSRPFGPQFGLKIRGGGGLPWPLPQIRHCLCLTLFFLDSCVQVKEREGNSTEAVNLYLKAGLPAKAARLAMSREVCPYVDQIYSHPPLFSSDNVSF